MAALVKNQELGGNQEYGPKSGPKIGWADSNLSCSCSPALPTNAPLTFTHLTHTDTTNAHTTHGYITHSVAVADLHGGGELMAHVFSLCRLKAVVGTGLLH